MSRRAMSRHFRRMKRYGTGEGRPQDRPPYDRFCRSGCRSVAVGCRKGSSNNVLATQGRNSTTKLSTPKSPLGSANGAILELAQPGQHLVSSHHITELLDDIF